LEIYANYRQLKKYNNEEKSEVLKTFEDKHYLKELISEE
jgi:hypothetical protein